MSTNSTQKKAKNPKVQALIDAIDAYNMAKERLLKIKTAVHEQEHRQYREFLDTCQRDMGLTPEKIRNLVAQRADDEKKLQEEIERYRERKSKPLPLP